jgi:predicted dienelactone hydrolase
LRDEFAIKYPVSLINELLNGVPVSMHFLVLIAIAMLTACVKSPDGTITDDQRNREIDFAIWLPEASNPAPLILLSHGSGGHYINFGWLTNALLDAGYVVAAVNHPFNTVRDETPEGVVRVWDRPPDLSLLLSYLLEDPRWNVSIDASRIGAAGFSSGGYTVIALAGAIYELGRMQSYCAGERRGADCDLAPMLSGPESEASASLKDSRVRAVFSMAPAVGPAITPESLAGISIPISIFATEDDEWLQPDLNAEYYAKGVPGAELTLLPRGGHFLFLSCDPVTAAADWFIGQFNLCGRGIDVDRDATQRDIAAKAVEFFNEHLSRSGETGKSRS